MFVNVMNSSSIKIKQNKMSITEHDKHYFKNRTSKNKMVLSLLYDADDFVCLILETAVSLLEEFMTSEKKTDDYK